MQCTKLLPLLWSTLQKLAILKTEVRKFWVPNLWCELQICITLPKIMRGELHFCPTVPKILWRKLQFCLTVSKILRGELQFTLFSHSVIKFMSWITILPHSVENFVGWITILSHSPKTFERWNTIFSFLSHCHKIYELNNNFASQYRKFSGVPPCTLNFFELPEFFWSRYFCENILTCGILFCWQWYFKHE